MIEAAAPERRAFLYALGAANLLFVVIDVASGWPHAGAVLAGRGLLGAVLLGCAWLLGRVRTAAAARRLVLGATAAAAAALDVIAWGAGGAAGPYVPLLAIVPMILFIAVPDLPAPLLLCGALVAVPALAMLVASGARPASLALWAAAFASATGYAVVGAALHRRVRRREAETADALAVSEARRARAERLALAGRLAAGVAHGVNNPLASVLANVRFAERALAQGDAAEALADARHGIERIRRLVLDLATLTRHPSEEPSAIEVEVLVQEARRLAQVRGIAVESLDVPRGLPRVAGRRHGLAQLLAGVLVSAADAARAEDSAPAPLALAARADGGRLLVSVRPAAAVRADRRVLDEDPLVLLAREQLEASGGALEVEPGDAPAIVFALPVEAPRPRS